MFKIEDVIKKIENGKILILAGDEELLRKLPKGKWIAGTIPYFIGKQGGVMTKELIHIFELPDYVIDIAIKKYNESILKNVYVDEPDKSFSFIIIPALSPTHSSFATNAINYKEFAKKPLIGWISGVDFTEIGTHTPKIINGLNLDVSEDGAIVMHVQLPETKYAEINIVNIFEQGTGDSITFDEDGFRVKEAYINGVKQNFADYVKRNNINIKLPLVANYSGAMINTSFKQIDFKPMVVDFYAPIFKGVEYKLAKNLDDYVTSFTSQMPKEGESIVFSCNCILNYFYSKLEGKKTGNITGPITFGEIAYQLLNQTMVYLTIKDF